MFRFIHTADLHLERKAIICCEVLVMSAEDSS